MDEEEVLFCQDSLPNMSFLAFEEMRREGELCDVSLRLQDSTITAHRIVLAAGIPYFRSLFTKGADKQEEKEIAVADLDPSELESLINFAYSSKVTISAGNAHSLLLAAHFLELSEVTEACVNFLSARLHLYSLLEVRILAHNIGNCKLSENCTNYIQQNFGEFSKTKDFLSLLYEDVKDIISQDELNVSNEETVFEAVINWVKFSPPQRRDKLPNLLREVRMTSFSTEYLTKRAATEELVRASTACRDLIQDVQSFHLLPEKERVSLNLNTVPRKGRGKNIYAICRSAPYGYSVHCCDFTNHTWHNLKSDTSNRQDIYRAFVCDEYIYVLLENRITTFHLKTLEWNILLETTHKCIEGSSGLVHSSLIYLFGSHDSSFYNKVRCFDTCQNKWLKESKMKYGRSNVATTSVEETIYVTGGYWKDFYFNTAETFKPSTRKWCELQPMLQSRCFHGCASINRKIYVFGGVSRNDMSLRSSEMYDPLTNLWRSISPMQTGRRLFSFVAHNKKIYAFGGLTVFGLFSSTLEAEFYDAECDLWKLSFDVPKGFVMAVVM